jgi:hypothetical protein
MALVPFILTSTSEVQRQARLTQAHHREPCMLPAIAPAPMSQVSHAYPSIAGHPCGHTVARVAVKLENIMEGCTCAMELRHNHWGCKYNKNLNIITIFLNFSISCLLPTFSLEHVRAYLATGTVARGRRQALRG